ncbi:MAG: glycosyltransferase [Candidatus Omnitrophica bacterium]|nr:glycosyltransferase [Candidatus Omnitrophota bacterium]
MPALRVMHIVQSLDMGGLENVVLNAIKHSDKEKFNFAVCCLSEKSDLREQLQSEGIQITYLKKRRGFDLSLAFKMAEMIKKKKIDILHTHNQRPQFYGSLAAKISGTILIHTRHGRDEFENRKSVFLSRFFTVFADKVVPVSEDIRRSAITAERVPQNKFNVIRNGIDAGKFANVTVSQEKLRESLEVGLDDSLIGIVARLEKVKNHKLLMDAFKKVIAIKLKCKLLIIGDGALKNELVRYANMIGIIRNTLFLGLREDIPELLSVLDVFALTSFSEGISLVLLEAMASGKPIVATDVGGNSELIENGINGFLVSSGDVEAVAASILKILNDDRLSRKMSAANQKKAFMQFDISRMCSEYEKLYESMIGKNI